MWLQEDLAYRLTVVQVLVGGRGLGERKGAIYMGHNLAFSIPGKYLLSPASEQVRLVPEVPHVPLKGRYFVKRAGKRIRLVVS